jgi:IS5 family transposase
MMLTMSKRSPPPQQMSFASYEFSRKKRVMRRERFLAEMEQVVPWARLEAVIEPLYPRAGRVGRQPIGVPKMLRMVFCGPQRQDIGAGRGRAGARGLLGCLLEGGAHAPLQSAQGAAVQSALLTPTKHQPAQQSLQPAAPICPAGPARQAMR